MLQLKKIYFEHATMATPGSAEASAELQSPSLILYTRPRSSSFVDVTTNLSFLPKAPDMAPRALCRCQPVAAMIASIVAPSGA